MKRLPHLQLQAWLLLLCAAFHLSTAQQLVYTSYYVTSCVDPDSPPVDTGNTHSTKHNDENTSSVPGHVSYTMPECLSCGCETCTVKSTFTTSYAAFCPGATEDDVDHGRTGLTKHTYTVTETYVGMSSLPEFASLTGVPFGFTTSMATCTACDKTVGDDGSKSSVVETMTYPTDGSPYALDGECSKPCDGDEETTASHTSKTTKPPTGVSNSTAPAVVPTSGAVVGYSEMNRGMALLVAAAAIVAAM